MAKYKIKFTPRAKKEYNKLDRSVLEYVDSALSELAKNPRTYGVKKLKGSKELWRIKADYYRIIYKIYDDIITVLVVRIENRDKAYNNLGVL
ncbi:MAG: type II toxin-antitoxin system RelE/ParE family toxin [Synergistaceae bacterium]|nr:type II toxin-antitoxin system RelE/ParE family toxin [Synergistaceae bacterium]MBQ6737222.1 type II toxin-antitoxin system RelE/ParE family toxin [Synergistaceae bacterium]MBQ7068683.1 type II toxin-antitoxin system RelE/ParE family toxin [Synergistaceae bacterium]MBR0074970.1 type II toxin-antitoxin system RelE/ParE family toxin [Synergistaceae bacterium]MBR0080806.1 type II toxin-antitoxin system RelE/ParE family toxin [Synergistaceae bacterium]